MHKSKTYACTAMILTACGGRQLDATSDGDTDGSSSSDTASSTVSVTLGTTEAPTTDPTTGVLDTGDVTTDVDPDSGSSTDAPSTTGNASESCCEVHPSPGCEEPDVAACVCEASPECCVFEWAANCVELATTTCEATCMGASETSGEGSTGEPVVDCEDAFQLEYSAEDAALDGWELVESAFPGEGTVAGIILDQGEPEGTVTWDVEVPCNDEWHIWVRGRNSGSNDSYFAQLDGGPDPAPIFDLDCGGGNDYRWRELNWRDPIDGGFCEYVEDPWIATWEAGTHQVQLGYRESPAVSRIIVTNDDAFVPE